MERGRSGQVPCDSHAAGHFPLPGLGKPSLGGLEGSRIQVEGGSFYKKERTRCGFGHQVNAGVS